MSRQMIALLLAMVLPVVALASPNIRPVPGSGAAWLYFPENEDSRAVLKVVKETGMGLEDDYEVHITFDSHPEELLCASTTLNCEKNLGAGTVKLRIKGDWAPNNTSVNLPMSGKFSGACSAVDTTCQFVLQPGATRTVRIKTGCHGQDYSVVKLGGNAEALCIGVSMDGQNHLLLAAHKQVGSGLRPKNKKETWGYNSHDDGIANTQTILSKWTGATTESAAHYCKNLDIGSGSSKLMDWYLPAINELKMALAGWNSEVFLVQKNVGGDGYYSSTEDSSEKTRTLKWSSSSSPIKDEEAKYKDKKGDTLCIKGVAP